MHACMLKDTNTQQVHEINKKVGIALRAKKKYKKRMRQTPAFAIKTKGTEVTKRKHEKTPTQTACIKKAKCKNITNMKTKGS